MRILFFITNTNREYFGPGYLSAVLKKGGHEVGLVRTLRKDFLASVQAFDPDILAFSTFTGLHRHFLDINKKIKKILPHVFSIFGGPHATFFPEIIKEEGVDAVCIGEAEDALLELVERMKYREDMFDVKNFWFKQDGQIKKNGLRPLSHDLDNIPFPDRELFYEGDQNLRFIPIRSILTGRGCPYSCSYCFNHAMRGLYEIGNKEYCRKRSVENVIEEIQQLTRNYRTKFLMFSDDLFVVSQKWLEEFTIAYRKNLSIPFTCNIRPLSAKDSIFKLLKEAGCISVQMAIESGNDKIRHDLLNRRESRENIIKTAEMVRRNGMKLYTQNIIGLPGETLENMLETIDLNRKCRPHHPEVTIFQPYPKTTLGEHCGKLGLPVNLDEMSATYHKNANLSEVSDNVVENLHHFFAILVKMPKLKPFILGMLKFPRNTLFWLFYRIWYGLEIRYFLAPGMTIIEKMRAIRQYFVQTF
jgi:radical SAM superfamily enzyme YgiQ (UPF0313 family)